MGLGLSIGDAVGASVMSSTFDLVVALTVSICAMGLFHNVQRATEDE